MGRDFKKYEHECEALREENAKLLDAFAEWLVAKGLAEKTIEQHTRNIDFYINEFLLYDDAVAAADGVASVGMFLGYWFIRKAMWASATSIRSNAASLKKFYQFMREQGRIDQLALDELKSEIKGGLPEWLATLSRYDDPYIEDPEDIWQI